MHTQAQRTMITLKQSGIKFTYRVGGSCQVDELS
jgi:hypothetical protein